MLFSSACCHGSHSHRGWTSRHADGEPSAGAGDADEHWPGDTGGQRPADHGAHRTAEQPDTGSGGAGGAGAAADTSGARVQPADHARSGAGAAPTGADRTDSRRTDFHLSACCHR